MSDPWWRTSIFRTVTSTCLKLDENQFFCVMNSVCKIKPDVGGQHCPSPIIVSFLSRFPGKSCPVSVRPDSVCLDSVRCPIFLKNAVLSLSVRIFAVSILSGVRILEKSCPLSVCPTGQGQKKSCPDFHQGYKSIYCWAIYCAINIASNNYSLLVWIVLMRFSNRGLLRNN